MAKGTTAGYVKYAIGEIILVVVGILIALSINNWNAERVSDHRNHKLLRALVKDLEADTTRLRGVITICEKYIEDRKNLLSRDRFTELSSDSLSKAIEITSPFLDLAKTTFNKISNLGIPNITKNDSLNKAIYRYYEFDESLSTLIRFNIEVSRKAYYSIYFEAGIEEDLSGVPAYNSIQQFQSEGATREAIIALLSGPRGRNIFKYDLRSKVYLLKNFKTVDQNASNLIREIQHNLKV